ncbi:8538_t:CDS:2 [Paraglomus brasilianum]|uniref:8538_t:CDS:1 n=1 Tax=Paraglomus brasilianum TaxID=144538 RepID=A0A9N9CVI5_9GLOM|nr:8538_t:CDS:2 [Paraglomus brasilianum]
MENQDTRTFEDLLYTDNYMEDDDIYAYTCSIPIFEESEGESDKEYEEQEYRTDELRVNEEFAIDDVQETEIEVPKEELSPCIIVTNNDGSIRRCGRRNSENQRRFWNLAGVWEVDKRAVEEMENEPEKLGICYKHYMFDRNYLHVRDSEHKKSHTSSIIRKRRCMFCNKNFGVFSRGSGCEEHCWSFLNKTIQTPCIGQHKCPAIGKTGFPPLVKKAADVEQARYICCACYESLGGHLHQQMGRGNKEKKVICTSPAMKKHDNDTDESMRLLTNWMSYVTKKNDINLKKRDNLEKP